MKLYYSRGACSLVPRIIIHEIGAPAEFESVDLGTKKTETGADFLKINPKGAVPTLALENQEILTENAVILQYLADKYKASQLLPHVGDIKRYHVMEWINYVATELHKGCGPLFNPKLSQEIKDTIFIPLLKSKLDFVEHHLEGKHYLVEETFTLPDAYLFVILLWLRHFKIDLATWPNLNRYFSNLKERKSVEQALREENIS